jgi:hypothetical protein
VEAPFEDRADVPREYWEHLDLREYIEGWAGAVGAPAGR